MISISSELADFGRQLSNIENCVVLEQQFLSKYTSYCIGGPTAYLVAPKNDYALVKALKLIHQTEYPVFILGQGSNVLVSDAGWPGITIYFGRNFSGWKFESDSATVKSGTRLIDLVQASVARGMAGMEQLAGIPGSVGGALKMNAGAFGQEIKNVTQSVHGYRLDGTSVVFNCMDISFGHRSAPELDSIVIAGGSFHFEPEEPARLMDRMEEILALRARKQPLNHPSCGSVFKRPPGYYAGALIEGADLKGVRIGDAMVSQKHGGFIVNLGNATACHVYQLIRMVEKRVWDRFGVRLEREVRLIGDFESASGSNGNY